MTEAEDQLISLRETCEASFGLESGPVVLVYRELALTYLQQKRYEAASQLSQKSLDISSSVFGDEHDFTWSIRLLLARAHRSLSRLEMAQDLAMSVLRWSKGFRGDNHLLTLYTTHVFGLIQRDKEDLPLAEHYISRALEGGLRLLGLLHPATLTIVHDLAMVYKKQRRAAEGEELAQLASSLRKTLLGSQHPTVLEAEKEARQFAKNGKVTTDRSGNDSKTTNPLIETIRCAAKEEHQLWAAQRIAQEMDEVLGEEHWESVESRRLLAMLEIKHGNYTNAVKDIERSWRMHRKALGPTDMETLSRLFELCRCWQSLGTFQDNWVKEAPQALSWTVKAQHYEFFEFLLEQQIDLNLPDEERNTSLFQASTLGAEFAGMARQLIEAGADVRCVKDGFMPLHTAAQKGHQFTVDFLLKGGANPDALSADGRTALFLASQMGHAGIVKKLVDAGAQVNLAAPFIFPLLIAVHEDHQDVVEILLDAGAELENENFGMTPVVIAVEYQRTGILEYLLNRNANANPRHGKGFALHTAAKKGSQRIVNILLNYKVDIDMPNGVGCTALHKAAKEGNEGLTSFLLSKGAEKEYKSQQGLTALHYASRKGHSNVVEKLLDAGAIVGSVTNFKVTALHFAATAGSLETVDALLEHGADPEALSVDGPVLYSAVEGRNPDVVQRLLTAGADANSRSCAKSWTPLHHATSFKSLPILELLLHNGGKPDSVDSQGLAPLHIASSAGEVSLIRRLVREGSVEVNGQTINGATALHYAAFRGHIHVANFLLGKGANANLMYLGSTTPLAVAAWSLHRAVISKLVAATNDPLRLDCYGRNALDWVTPDETELARFGQWQQRYVPTGKVARQHHVRQSVRTLLSKLCRSRVAGGENITTLGRCLLIVEDTTEAELAYQLDVIEKPAEEPLEYRVACKGCDAYIKGEIYACLACAERHLCSACMAKYADGTATIRNCKAHDYHQISQRHWQGSYVWPLDFRNLWGESVDEWLERLLKVYGKMDAS